MILFNSRTTNSWLSNFYPLQITIDNITYPSVENYYQAYKSIDISTRLEFINMSAVDARRKGKNEPVRSDWNSLKELIMRKGLEEKYKNPELLALLLSTKNEKLVHLSPWDMFWGVDNDLNGNNILGKMIEYIRSSYILDDLL